MNNDHHPVVNLLNRIRSEIYDHILQGKARYDRDSATLKNHLQLAQEMNNPFLMGKTLNIWGILEQYFGHSRLAIERYTQGYEAFKTAGDTGYMATMQNNVGEVYRLMSRYDEALQHYREADRVLEQAGGEHIRARALVDNNLGLVYLEREDYEQAAFYLNRFMNSVAAETWEHVDILIEARRALAEVFLARQDFAQAWHNVNESQRLANERSHHLLLAETHLTRAHIAEADPNSPEDAAAAYAGSRAELAKLTAPINTARTLLHEAQYQQRHGNLAKATALATEAHQVFQSLGFEEEIALSAALMS